MPPAFGRLGAELVELAPAASTVRLPLTPELLLPDGAPTAGSVALSADFGLTTAVVASLPDLRGVTTVSMVVDHLALPPASGSLTVRCRAAPFAEGRPQHCSGAIHDDAGRPIALASGWFLATTTSADEVDRVGLVHEDPAPDGVLGLLGIQPGPQFDLQARDAVSNALGTLHGGVGALACTLAAEQVLDAGMRALSTCFAFLRPTPRGGGVHVRAEVVRAGRRTASATTAMTGPQGRLLLQAHVTAARTDG